MLNFLVNHSRKLLLATAMSFFVTFFMLLSTSSATAVPKPLYREGVETAGKINSIPSEGTPIKKQGNLAAAVDIGIIDRMIYRYNPAKNFDAYLAWNIKTGDGGLITDVEGNILTKLSPYEVMQIHSKQYVWTEGRDLPYVAGDYFTNLISLAFDYPDLYVSTGSVNLTVNNYWTMISIPLKTPALDGPSTRTDFMFDKIKNIKNPPYWEYNLDEIDLTANYLAPNFVPGRGYWVKKASKTGPSTLGLTGIVTPVNHQFPYKVGGFTLLVNQYAMQVPSDGGDNEGTHMIGNPFEIERELQTIWFEMTPIDYAGMPLAKPASWPTYEDLNAVKTWNINLKLSDTAGLHLDGQNMAGVLETGKDFHDVYCAEDMVAPIPEYIRLAFKNPDDASSLLAWDFRGPGQDKYEWNVELSTNIASIATKLSLDNFKEIPSDYVVTLTDTQTGTVYSLTGDSSFDVALTSSTPKNFVLTATRQKPVVVAEAGPVALALNNIFPNPFNPSTTISFDVKKAGVVNLGVYNISGQLVDTLVNSPMTAGSHQIVWNAAKNSSGVYIVRLTSNGFTDTKKVTFMK